jgi:SAM-dependent methyltransferase
MSLQRRTPAAGAPEPAPPRPSSQAPRDRYRADRIAHWDEVARATDRWQGVGAAYHRRLGQIYRTLIPPGRRVLEIGCGCGDLLSSVTPVRAVGLDFSAEMIRRGRARHPQLLFVECEAADLGQLGEAFDFIVLSDLINDLWDVQEVLEAIRAVSTPHARVILNFYSRLWAPPLSIARKLGLARPTLPQNWLTVSDVTNLLALADFERIRHWEEVLLPVSFPLVAPLCNRVLVKLWPFRFLALSNFVVARPARKEGRRASTSEPSVSVIVPARNEAGNVPAIFARTPPMGSATEIVFVEGHSRDDTLATIEREITAHPERTARLLRQSGIGKGDAVRLGFAEAHGDVLMILDADLSVPPEDLPRFYEVLRSGKGEFVNGVRLVYPMEKQAMRVVNFLGNKFFSWAFSWLLGQPIKDTLCGTKALDRRAYAEIAANRSYFGDFDPFGDFDLLFGAARLDLKIVEVPIRYHERTYGTTNIQRWRHGWLLLQMCAVAAKRLKFV